MVVGPKAHRGADTRVEPGRLPHSVCLENQRADRAGCRAVAETVEARRGTTPEKHPDRQAVPGREFGLRLPRLCGAPHSRINSSRRHGWTLGGDYEQGAAVLRGSRPDLDRLAPARDQIGPGLSNGKSLHVCDAPPALSLAVVILAPVPYRPPAVRTPSALPCPFVDAHPMIRGARRERCWLRERMPVTTALGVRCDGDGDSSRNSRGFWSGSLGR